MLAISWSGLILISCLVQSSDMPQINIPNLDKAVHAFFHFVFTSLWFLFFKNQLKSTTISKPLSIAFGFSVLFGIGIEILQALFTMTRSADVFDVVANITGATVAVIGIILIDKYYKKDTINSEN
ncbi:MAG: VanZ family protein [Flavobacterium sp.]|uniref:VanZ family protein n=1 Tax=Flavobacterium sp. TaxID=239 RepID=UPI0026205527|nr:VanZ family protein [Flavobacterium sp.]MDD5151352.1 VanZ family protein [Flavobacterium sp.]